MSVSPAAGHAHSLLEAQPPIPYTKKARGTQPPPIRSEKAGAGGLVDCLKQMLSFTWQLSCQGGWKNKNLSPGSKGPRPQPAPISQTQARETLESPPDRRPRSQCHRRRQRRKPKTRNQEPPPERGPRWQSPGHRLTGLRIFAYDQPKAITSASNKSPRP